MEKTTKVPLPGYGLAIIDKSQFENVDYQGDDRFDTPQVGKLIILHDDDHQDMIDKTRCWGDLLGKKVYWCKYADQDATFFDNSLNADIVFIKLEKIVGYDKE